MNRIATELHCRAHADPVDRRALGQSWFSNNRSRARGAAGSNLLSPSRTELRTWTATDIIHGANHTGITSE